MRIDKMINFSDFVCEDRISWFWEDRNKAIFCIDMETYAIDCVSVCPFTEIYCEQMFKAITKVNEHIILASRCGKAIIADYNCTTDELHLIDVSKY